MFKLFLVNSTSPALNCSKVMGPEKPPKLKSLFCLELELLLMEKLPIVICGEPLVNCEPTKLSLKVPAPLPGAGG